MPRAFVAQSSATLCGVLCLDRAMVKPPTTRIDTTSIHTNATIDTSPTHLDILSRYVAYGHAALYQLNM